MEVIQTIRTSPPKARREIPDRPDGRIRLIAKVVREIAASRRFEGYAELKAELRARLARLHVRYKQNEFDDAVSLVGSNVRLFGPPQARPRPTERAASVRDLSRTDVAAILAQIRQRFGDCGPRRMS
jgi:hypothetical protein